jgi:hypothetical protein
MVAVVQVMTSQNTQWAEQAEVVFGEAEVDQVLSMPVEIRLVMPENHQGAEVAEQPVLIQQQVQPAAPEQQVFLSYWSFYHEILRN